MNVGDRVRWIHRPRGGYGYEVMVPGVVVALHPKRVTIRVKLRDGEEVLRRVSADNLRAPEEGAGDAE